MRLKFGIQISVLQQEPSAWTFSKTNGELLYYYIYHRRQVLKNRIKPGGGKSERRSGGLAPQKICKILDAQISIYSYCCYLGKRKSRTIVEEKCNWDIFRLRPPTGSKPGGGRPPPPGSRPGRGRPPGLHTWRLCYIRNSLYHICVI